MGFASTIWLPLFGTGGIRACASPLRMGTPRLTRCGRPPVVSVRFPTMSGSGFSQRHPRGKSSAYLLRPERTRSAQQALQGYGGRWACEGENVSLKTRLGLADFRVRCSEAVDRSMVVGQLAWGDGERRFIQERCAQGKCYGDIIRRHQEEHARDGLIGALQMALETGAIEPVLQRFLRETV